ncbi:hypothetical protein DMC30DRAFT_370727 [Rhodotorula diobovata]|uniref:Sugar phosphate transporter domain-containing protein n=1 Tax=Rhodotorula diobovata TaxID=5288 RepID=A0A5C5G6P6_9BASI|nr:hypothetical protein DMC30DRAFT_370727 [Rhodotorula diobovata]
MTSQATLKRPEPGPARSLTTPTIPTVPSSPSLSPPTTSAAPSKRPSLLPPWVLVLGWIGLSTTVIFQNRIILVERGFNYPVTLTSLHLLFQTVATRILHRFTTLISGPVPVDEGYASVPMTESGSGEHGAEAHASGKNAELERWKSKSVEMDWVTWRRQILPIAALFSVSLVLSNAAYLYCSVAFIHILKSFAPVAILLAAFAFRTKAFSTRLLGIVIVISLGVGIASWGETSFSTTGFALQMCAIAVEATRVTLIQLLLSPSAASSSPNAPPVAPAIATGMSPLKSLFFFAPTCLAFNLVALVVLEGMPALRAIPQLGAWTILSNSGLTLALNLSAVMLIGLSAMVLGLSKVVKDVLMVVLPVLLMGESLTLLQVVGYSIATSGLVFYKFAPN